MFTNLFFSFSFFFYLRALDVNKYIVIDCKVVQTLVNLSYLIFRNVLNVANGKFLETFRYWQTCHNSWIILQFQKSSTVRLHIIPPGFNSDFSDTLTTLSVLTQLRFLSKEKNIFWDQTSQTTFLQ